MSEVTPRDREEKLLAAIAEGTTGKLPTPRNRKEKLLKEIYDNGGTGGGGVTPAQVKTILLDNTDTALNGASSNPIANKALVAALADYVKSTDLSIPTKVSELINDKKYQTDSDLVTALTPYAKSDDVTAEIIAEIAKVVADAPEDFDTLKEMSDWIAGHEDEASAMNSAISDNKTAITALQTSKADKSEIPTTVAELTDSADYAKIADVNDSISALQTGKANTSDLTAHTGDSVIHVTAENKTLWNTVSNKVNKEDGKALLADTDKTNYDDAVTKAHTHDNKSVLDKITSDKVSAMNSQIQDNKQAIDNHTLNDDVHVTPENKTNWNKVSEKLDKTGDASDVITKFTTATTRSNLTTKEKLSISFGKISKWFSDLKTVAFSGSYNDLSNKPASLPASDVSAWAKASTKPTYTKAEVGLGNVDNTADANKSVKYATSSGNATKVNNHTVKSDVPENAKFTDTIYDDTELNAKLDKLINDTKVTTTNTFSSDKIRAITNEIKKFTLSKTDYKGIKTYPTECGVYRVTEKIDGIPNDASNYATLIIYGNGYFTHIYQDVFGRMWVGFTDNSIKAPTWRELETKLEKKTQSVDGTINANSLLTLNFTEITNEYPFYSINVDNCDDFSQLYIMNSTMKTGYLKVFLRNALQVPMYARVTCIGIKL